VGTDSIQLDQELPELQRWETRPTDQSVRALPGTPAVCCLVDASQTPVLLSTTQHLRRFVQGRLANPEPSARRADLAEVVRGVRWRSIHCPFEGRWRYYRLARGLHPRDYRRLVGFGPAWFLHLDPGAAKPEIRVTERIWQQPGAFIGPWPSERAARATLELLWDLFDLCRYPEQVRVAPGGKRCAYADMGRCDAPCDGSVPLDAYARRCRRAWDFLSGAHAPAIAALRTEMESAAAGRQFERASQLRDQLKAAEKWQRGLPPDLGLMAGRAWLLCLPVTRRKAWKVFAYRAGELVDGPVLAERKAATGAAAWAVDALGNPAQPPAGDEVIRMEHTWLVAHFLGNRERERAVVIDCTAAIPGQATLASNLEVQLQARRAAAPEPELLENGESAPPGPPEEN